MKRNRSVTKTEYDTIHKWIARVHGAANCCSNRKCTGEGVRFEWALKKGLGHGKDVKRYKMLCSKCHNIYDGVGPKFMKSLRRKFGRNFQSVLGKTGGATTSKRHGFEHYQKLSAKGKETLRDRYGSEFFINLAAMGREARKQIASKKKLSI